MKNAFCSEKEIEFNPVLDWAKNLIFTNFSKLEIKRPAKFGGNVSFNSYGKLEEAFAKGKLHPMDLKNAVSEALIKLLEPARKHFSQPKIRKMKEELEALKITR